MLSEVDIAWAAGFFDGEACVGLYPNKRANGTIVYKSSISVSQVVRAPLEKLQEMFGGVIDANPARGNFQTIWIWRIGGLSGDAALTTMRPYMRVKGRQVDALLGFRGITKRRGLQGRLTPEEIAVREGISLTLRAMKKDGASYAQ